MSPKRQCVSGILEEEEEIEGVGVGEGFVMSTWGVRPSL